MVLKPSRVFALLAIRPSFSTALDGGSCQGEFKVIIMMRIMMRMMRFMIMMTIRPSFSSALDGGGCQGES